MKLKISLVCSVNEINNIYCTIVLLSKAKKSFEITNSSFSVSASTIYEHFRDERVQLVEMWNVESIECFWSCSECGIFFCHCRLKLLDNYSSKDLQVKYSIVIRTKLSLRSWLI